MDGSEPGNSVAAAVLSGAPVELQARTVRYVFDEADAASDRAHALPDRIYRPSKTATQSGEWHGHHWRMDWDVLGKGHRWENPLMGWQSSGDFMHSKHLNFNSKEDAIRFAQKQGYEYLCKSRMSGGSYQRHTRITSYITRRS
jgi:NADH dehydrogenase (ubiquinone) Fe-S protein 4